MAIVLKHNSSFTNPVELSLHVLKVVLCGNQVFSYLYRGEEAVTRAMHWTSKHMKNEIIGITCVICWSNIDSKTKQTVKGCNEC